MAAFSGRTGTAAVTIPCPGLVTKALCLVGCREPDRGAAGVVGRVGEFPCHRSSSLAR